MIEPPVPAELDLRDFAFMPLDVIRLRDSDLIAVASAEGFRAAVMLWCAAWHQVPASSLPNDDRMLSRLAGYGNGIKSWLSIKSEALRGFVECADGRLYHGTIAEKALEGWIGKLGYRKSSAAGNAAKQKKPFDPKPFDDTIDDALQLLASLNPSSPALARRLPSASRRETNRDADGKPIGYPNGSAIGFPSVVPFTSRSPPK